MRLIHLEDDGMKHSAIKRVLNDMGITEITWVKNVEDGMDEIKAAIKNDTPFDLAITDMQYYLRKGEKVNPDAGDIFIEKMKNNNIDIPIIVCSSFNLDYKNVYGCVWYVDNNDWETQLRNLLKALSI
jgi:CheY-like chemotaxis protein